MRKISAVICELNPFHEGHRHIFECAKKESDVLIAVMSGNFVQRGETAVYDKYKRARSALEGGADLVVELPFPYCASSAEFFAAAGVRIAEGVGATHLYFGSECGDIDALRKVGEVLSGSEYRSAMTKGQSAHLRGEIIKRLTRGLPESVCHSANDILGAEYCRNAVIETVAVKRISCESASSIRERYVGDPAWDMLDMKVLTELEYNFFRTRRAPEDNIAECGGGVYERLYNTAFESKCPSEWAEKIRTKQYTNGRLRRASLFALCSVTAEEMKRDVAFTRVLGFNEKGRAYLSECKKGAKIPVITNTSEAKRLVGDALLQVQLSDFADSVYCLCKGECDPAFFLKKPPVVLE